MERLADTADDGVGGIYRRFASIDELVTVVLEAKMTHHADRTEHSAERAFTELWNAFADYLNPCRNSRPLTWLSARSS